MKIYKAVRIQVRKKINVKNETEQINEVVSKMDSKGLLKIW